LPMRSEGCWLTVSKVPLSTTHRAVPLSLLRGG
jgi:hypothetical protein